MPPEERERLRSIVETAHENGQRVRFWATPELSPQREAVWEELLAAQVALEAFLLDNDPEPAEPYVSWKDPTGARHAGP